MLLLALVGISVDVYAMVGEVVYGRGSYTWSGKCRSEFWQSDKIRGVHFTMVANQMAQTIKLIKLE